MVESIDGAAGKAIGLHLDHEGWADITALIVGARQSGRELDGVLIRSVVESSDKKRFAISEDGLRIRAVQGHSNESVAIIYAEREPPEFLYHGTATRFLESILKEGLKRGERQHVHLSEDAETAKAVGQRYGKAVVLKIQALQMYQQGFKFSQAENGVWSPRTMISESAPWATMRTSPPAATVLLAAVSLLWLLLLLLLVPALTETLSPPICLARLLMPEPEPWVLSAFLKSAAPSYSASPELTRARACMRELEVFCSACVIC